VQSLIQALITIVILAGAFLGGALFVRGRRYMDCRRNVGVAGTEQENIYLIEAKRLQLIGFLIAFTPVFTLLLVR